MFDDKMSGNAMNAEIELKLFSCRYIKNLINKLDSLDNAVPQGKRRLANGYFDTLTYNCVSGTWVCGCAVTMRTGADHKNRRTSRGRDSFAARI